MRIGYARVSIEDQTIDLQKDALKHARCRETYEEHATGKNTARPQLETCLKSLREGDTFAFFQSFDQRCKLARHHAYNRKAERLRRE